MQGNERRIALITNVCEVLDHWDEPKHNMELFNNCASLLTKALQVISSEDEIRMICAALEMVFRGSAKSVQNAYDKLNNTLLPKLVRLLETLENGQHKHADITILNISKIILYLSRCADLRVPLCRTQGLLEALLSPNHSTPDVRVTRLRVLGNFAHSDENKIILYEHPGVLEFLLRVAHTDGLEVARQNAGAALMDLASAPSNQLSMASNDRILGTLVKMILTEQAAQTREYVITALQNLAFCKVNRLRLVEFKSGIVLEALKKAVSSDPDAKSRRRAAGALTNLACEETALAMGNHKGLLDALAICSTTDETSEVQTRASLALTKIATHVTLSMPCHDAVLDALVVASLSKSDNSVSAVLRVKARDPEYREKLARHPGILDTLADICVSESASSKDRDNAIRALMHLVNEDANRKIMCNKSVMQALVTGAAWEDDNLEEARDSAIIAIERLATEFTNRSYMARHPRLLVVVAQAVEREAVWDEEGRESEHGYLAKPLLMSLLVAM
jgi:hypothetical protein